MGAVDAQLSGEVAGVAVVARFVSCILRIAAGTLYFTICSAVLSLPLLKLDLGISLFAKDYGAIAHFAANLRCD